MTLLPSEPPAPALCPVCETMPPSPDDPLCQGCRRRADAQLRPWMLLDPAARVLLTCGVEALLGMVAGLLVLMPLALAAGQAPRLASPSGLLLMCAVGGGLVGCVALFYQLIMKMWIAYPGRWALAKAGGLGALAVQVGLLGLLGLRLDTRPEWLISALVVPLEWVIGVTVALWQTRLLVPPFQRAGVWRRWSVAGWTSASLAHLGLALLSPPSGDGMTLVVGTVLSFVVCGAASHTALARFELDARLAARAGSSDPSASG